MSDIGEYTDREETIMNNEQRRKQQLRAASEENRKEIAASEPVITPEVTETLPDKEKEALIAYYEEREKALKQEMKQRDDDVKAMIELQSIIIEDMLLKQRLQKAPLPEQ